MGMNPDTNRMEHLQELEALVAKAGEADKQRFVDSLAHLVRPDGSPVPKHWSIFRVGENYVINGYTFKCAYIGETSILFEPVGPVVLGEKESK